MVAPGRPTLVAIALIMIVRCRSALSSSLPARPNILVLFADDLGYGDLSSFGHPTTVTPHLLIRLIRHSRAVYTVVPASPSCAVFAGRDETRLLLQSSRASLALLCCVRRARRDTTALEMEC